MATQLDLKWVRETEDRLGGPLPADYVAILRRRNGWYGVFDDEQWHFFPIFDKTDRKSISKTAECIDRETTSLRKGFPYFPQDGVVVADNQAGAICTSGSTARRTSSALSWMARRPLALGTSGTSWTRRSNGSCA